MPLYVVLVHQVQGLFSGFLPTLPRSLRSCLRLVVRRVNAHRGLSPPSSRPCWAYEKTSQRTCTLACGWQGKAV